jgi:protein-S-isoprenylcysteine O-methyltransferase Ste14
VPERWLHRAIRVGALALFGWFLWARVRHYPNFALKPLWFVETLIYVVLAAAYVLRTDPVDRSRGWREVALPGVGALLPFALLFTPPNPWFLARPRLLLAVFWWMTAATALTVWGIWALRRCFSITAEARSIVTCGPYRWLRHPIYTGEVLTALAVSLWRFSPRNAALFLAFALVQVARARVEEAKLAGSFPTYKSPARRPSRRP